MERPFQHALARLRLLAPRERVALHAPGGAQLLALDKAVHPLAAAEVELPRSIRLAPDCELGERGRRATFSSPKPHATEAERPCAYGAVRARPLCTDRSAVLRPQWLSSARARSPELGAAGGRGQQQRFDASLGAGGHCSRGAAAVRRVRDGLQLHWQLPERVWSAAIV